MLDISTDLFVCVIPAHKRSMRAIFKIHFWRIHWREQQILRDENATRIC
jgi:hypothetical protein